MTNHFLTEEGIPLIVADADGGSWVLEKNGTGMVACTVPDDKSSASAAPSGSSGLFLPIVVGLGLVLTGVL